MGEIAEQAKGEADLPACVVPPSQLSGQPVAVRAPMANNIPEMPDDWTPDTIRFEMFSKPANGNGRVALGAIVGPEDDPARVFENMRIAMWQAVNDPLQSGAPNPSVKAPACGSCGAPAWAANPALAQKG